MDRVKELSDASVPFGFDVHAMIYSENDPEQEASLHTELEQRRVNLVNGRKEFFNASLQEIEQIVKRKKSDIEFIRLAESRDYRESLAIIRNSEIPPETDAKHTLLDKFPENI
ncbi:GIY-YIG nuclease family protein [Sulfurivermis fontis]|uniref:GIY-YIG nuclease family protein n=1 Tax=Sulfurivermis fontis TaxID=1972068 RepID=UPI000FD905E0|nr:GIY-YIG nuclease family protein [Sulfurivermis fontis]